ncbi:BREX-6 system phosphatase PglZ [Nostoc punctiforme]|uniref:PglZ domain protein n=1 Tax=Nostoc punctiforme (strain ATCC 29133 / PCC 73102) TaxID=63737 RepID=B2J7H5_NOSP7|nr:BREX-6 system phosphatase PglZ [Nostoc punctiforme]ACC80910.1 PglZ domain protein [Nostoc punctiforme PCC 73102]
MSQLSPITTVLEAELKRELRQRGIVIWLDKDGYYNSYVDELIARYNRGDFFAPVVAFRGSYLEMVLALETYGNGLDPEPLLIHMPGHTEETIRKTPILELYRAGYRFRKAFDTLIREAVTGHVNPASIENYLNNGITDLQSAEEWLQNNLSQPQDGLAAYLTSLSLEWIVDGILGEDKVLQSRISDQTALNTLTEHLYRHTGMNTAFVCFFHGDTPLSFLDLGETFAAWLMCVEYVHDLTRPPHLDALQPLAQLSLPLRKTCKQLVEYLRKRHPDIYAAKAAIVESHLEQELNQISPEDLGQFETFQWEETAILQGAVEALLTGEFQKALHWSQSHTESASFWLERDRTRRLEWSLIKDAATLGYMIQGSGQLQGKQTLREALEYYTQTGSEVDKAHRRFEQQRLKLLEPTLPHFAQLLEAADKLRFQYRNWADTLAQDFAVICTTESFLPDDGLQQRTLYEQVVHPLTQGNKKVAYFLIDAFRYEMATELIQEFEGAGTTVTLKGRYAELPSITAVGMNILAPVNQNGRVVLAGSDGFKGFKTGEYTVRKPDERVRAMSEKSIDNISAGRRKVRGLTLAEVCNWSTTSLKQSCANTNLVVVHSREIDDAGEANVGLATFETWLQQIKSAWNHLKSIGINEFIFTADHGFLLQDQTTQEKPYRDSNRRYILAKESRSEEGMVTVSLNALKYEGQEGYLLFRKDTAVFATGNPGATFVHGGNSLQERVIPVLTVSHRHQSHLAMVKYLIEAKPEPNILDCSRIRVRVKPAPVAQGVLSFVGAREINVALRVPERPDIQVTIKDAPGAEVKNQQLQIAVEGDWIEVLFDLKGQRDERVRLEIYHPDNVEDVESIVPQTYFNVSGSFQGEVSTATELPKNTDWQDSFEDETVRRVFFHLQQHGSITEPELNQILGSARLVRRFSLDFEEHLKKVPFSVRIETTSNGKRYVKQN